MAWAVALVEPRWRRNEFGGQGFIGTKQARVHPRVLESQDLFGELLPRYSECIGELFQLLGRQARSSCFECRNNLFVMQIDNIA